MNEQELLDQFRTYLDTRIFQPHLTSLIGEFSNLSDYNVNLFLTPYLSKILGNDITPENLAKALYYPRVLGTSITTTFGSHIKKILVDLQLAEAYPQSRSNIIIFRDRVDGNQKVCFLKAGPNTINADDVRPIQQKLENIENFNIENKTIGIISGTYDRVSRSYLRLQQDHNINLLVGEDFWHRMTGFENFYPNILRILNEIDNTIDVGDNFQRGLDRLTDQIRESGLIE